MTKVIDKMAIRALYYGAPETHPPREITMLSNVKMIQIPGQTGHIDRNVWNEAVRPLASLKIDEPQEGLTIVIGDISLRFWGDVVKIDYEPGTVWRDAPKFTSAFSPIPAYKGLPDEPQDDWETVPREWFGTYNCDTHSPNKVLQRMRWFAERPEAGPLVISDPQVRVHVWLSEHGIGYTLVTISP